MRLLRTVAPLACVAAILLTCGLPAPRLAAQGRRGSHVPPRDVLRAAPGNANYRYGPTMDQVNARLEALRANAQTATITVTYDAGFQANPSAQAAFQAAINIWQQVIVSPATIRIRASFQDMGDTKILGTAGTTNVCTAGDPTTEYAAALADKLRGVQSCAAEIGETAEIDATFNSTFTAWDFGTSGVLNKYNFMTVVLHEIAHGLGFYGSATSLNGVGSFIYLDQGSANTFDVFDRFVQNGSGTAIIAFPNQSTTLHGQLTGNGLVFNGMNARSANGGASPKTESHDMTAQYSVASDHGWLSGSSYDHVDDVLYSSTPNGLMTWQLAASEVYTDPGPIVRGIFMDEGWTNQGGTSNCKFTLVPTGVTVGPAASSGSIAMTASAGTCAWTASSGNTAIATIQAGSASGTGSATISYNVLQNTAIGPRSVTLSIGGVPFTITQNGTGPTMTLDRSSLFFAGVNNGAAFTAVTGSQTIRLTQTGAPAVGWSAHATVPWLVLSTASGSGSTVTGSGTAALTVAAQFVGGLFATQAGTITITLTGAGNTVGPINVTLNSIAPSAAAPPFGSFDTPATGSTGIAGSIAVTGWALDDVQVTRVTVCRDPVSGETAVNPANCGGAAKIYIGDAVFVDGARTDVQALNPTLPLNSRAGWGYLMLTNFLPNLGNGTFVISSYAYDADGHTAALGSKTISCNNASSLTPFGAIDTPAQGAVVGGTIANGGWVLTQNPKDIPADSSTITVFVDGVSIGHPDSGRIARSDVTALFSPSTSPSYSISLAHAAGGKIIDTTTFTNGVHTIFWIVADTDGKSDGVGSRFFTISNGALLLDPGTASNAASQGPTVIAAASTLDVPRAAAARVATPQTLEAEIAAAPLDLSSVLGRRGFDLDSALQSYVPSSGRIDVQAEELDRIELHLSGTANHQYSGYLRAPLGLRPLPVGSTLNASTGDFAWMPGVGFYGVYDLTFVRWANGRAVARQDVRITLNAKGSNRVGPQTVIDVPSPGNVGSKDPAYKAGTPFYVGGWAADLDSMFDSGVNTVHMWAYPLEASGKALDPIFLGPAIYGGARPDVAAVYGDRFTNSGYGIIVNGLPPGTYDIAVFGFSTVVNGFTPAKVVRVVVR